jgi:endonuclease III-like uncharacterized protein
VVDAYTRRILARHQLGAENAPYEEIRELWERALSTIARETSGLARLEKRNLKSDSRPPAHRSSPISAAKRSSVAQIYNEMHGLIVAVGKHHCLKSKPRCEQCPLQRFLPNPVGHPI